MNSLVLLQPLFYIGMLMCRVIVNNQMQLLLCRCLLIDLFYKREKLFVSVFLKEALIEL